MADRKPPKILPSINYDPPFGGETEAPNNHDWRKGGGDFNPMNYYNPLQRIQPQGAQDMGNGETSYPNPSFDPLASATQPSVAPRPPAMWYDPIGMGLQAGQGIADWLRGGGQVPNLNPIELGNQAAQGIVDRRNAIPNPPPGGGTWTAGGGGNGNPWWNQNGELPDPSRPNTAPGTTPPGVAGPANDQVVSQWQATLDKNRGLTETAKATGNDKELARLQAEWDRIAPKAAKYGISAERLVNSYMQPGNSAAEPSLDRALGRAIADDTWAGAATIAFGRPPNQLEWDEHWRAMNKGGRDPLEGHPAAIQAIQAKMKEIEQENQNDAFGKYQDWLANQ